MKVCWIIIFFCAINSVVEAQKSSRQKQIILQSKDLVVLIDAMTGLPAKYSYKGAGITGTDTLRKIDVIVCRLQPREYVTVQALPKLIKSTPDQAVLLFNAVLNDKIAASFHLKYVLDGSALVVTMEEVSEREGYELIEASLPNLATVREEDGPGWLAHGVGGGAVVDLQKAKAFHLPDDEFFGRIGYVLPVAIVGTAKAQCVMEVSAYMDATEIEIVGTKGRRHARIGTVQTYRVHGGRAYNMNDGNPPNAGNSNTPNLIVGQTPRCRLDFTGDYDANGKVDWVDGAKVVASRMPTIPTTYYNDKFVYLVGGKYKPEKEPRTTFAQTEKMVRDISMLTDNAPQVALLGGWVYDGQDTGFPSEDSVNQSLGGYQGLKQLLAEGPKYNANISFNTNYDDAYKSSPVFDTAFIARRPDGQIWRSRDWAGEYSYITGMAKYMEKWAMPRIDYMMERYKIKDALLIDAVSWHSIRNDWDLKYPASGYKNLVDGKFKLLDEFRKRGVHVFSEQLRYPFIGRQPMSADGSGGGRCPFGGEPIPFLATIYRKSAIWGAGSFNSTEVQKNFFWNCRPTPWYVNATDRNAIADFYYMTVLPFSKVHYRGLETFERNGYRSIIGLESGSKIEVDWMNDDYTITADGLEIAGHNATYCPMDKDRIGCYSRNAKILTFALPKDWDSTTVAARALFTDRREVVPVKVDKGKISLSISGSRPVIVYRNAEIADRRK
ncbi:MAG TPA: endo-alpha-N-acetylgalactosaminidase family protein [Segetibacter sp.]|jgi:hypothetical protein